MARSCGDERCLCWNWRIFGKKVVDRRGTQNKVTIGVKSDSYTGDGRWIMSGCDGLTINKDDAFRGLGYRYLNAMASDGGHRGCWYRSRLRRSRVCVLRSTLVTLGILSHSDRILVS